MTQEQKKAREYVRDIYIKSREEGLVASWTKEGKALFLLMRLLPQLSGQKVKACVVAGVNARNLASPRRTAVILFTDKQILICGWDGLILRKRLIPWSQVAGIETCSAGSFDSVYFGAAARSFQICADDKETYQALLSFLKDFETSGRLMRGVDIFYYQSASSSNPDDPENLIQFEERYEKEEKETSKKELRYHE